MKLRSVYLHLPIRFIFTYFRRFGLNEDENETGTDGVGRSFTLLSSYFCFQNNVIGERERQVAEAEKVNQIGRRIAKGQIYMIAMRIDE